MAKNIVMLVALAMMLVSCSHGRTVYYPQPGDVENTCEVMILRDSNFYGLGLSLEVLLDDTVIAGVRSGEYMIFNVHPGMHALGIRQSIVSMAFEKGRTYYFCIGADESKFGFEFIEISEKRARELIKTFTPLS